MINDAQVFLSGYVAKEPKFRITASGHPTATVRVGYTPRRVDRETGEWADGATSFVTVVCWRALAVNVATCLRKGEPVLVRGRLQVRPYDKDGVSRLAVEIEASSLGHDLARGVANFQRARRSPGETALGGSGLAGSNGAGDGTGIGVSPGLGDGPGQADGAGLAGLAGAGASPADGEFFAEDAVTALAGGDATLSPDGGSGISPGDGPAMAGPDDGQGDPDTDPDGGLASTDGAAAPAGLSAPF
jgi:single-strand DNA-binding protein